MSKGSRAAKTRAKRGECRLGAQLRKARITKARLKAAFARTQRPAEVKPKADFVVELLDESERYIAAQEWQERRTRRDD